MGGLLAVTVHGADPGELLYNYAVFKPRHAFKPRVELGAERRIEERFTRGVVATGMDDGRIHVSWRLLKSDPPDIAFDVYGREGNSAWRKLTDTPVTQTCDYTDTSAASAYCVVAAGEAPADTPAAPASAIYWRVPLKDSIEPRCVAIGDLNGDGLFDFVVQHPNINVDPAGRGNTNGVAYKLDAYLHDGTFLWQHDLGDGIEPGIWFSPFIVYDFDGDGKAEVALKTAPPDVRRDADGRVTSGGEHLSVLDGMTGQLLAQADWPPRTPRLGDRNRINRNQLSVAWLDGKTPCILTMRGTYKAMFVDAWHYAGGALRPVWKWDGDEEHPVIRAQGAHNSQCADIDGDGRDEIVLGSAVLDDNGTLLWSAGLGHPDSAILTTVDPTRKGMQILYGIEVAHETRGVCLVDAKNGRRIWDLGKRTLHVGGAMAADIDPARPGLECFAVEDRKSGSAGRFLLDAKGRAFDMERGVPGTRHWVWWDADCLRENFKSRSRQGTHWTIVKHHDGAELAMLEGRIVMIADLHGDWREEVVTALPGELRIYTSTIPARDRRVTLLQDSKYRVDVINASQGYYQSPTPSYYLGESCATSFAGDGT